jgi:hypothetical protein
MGQLFILISDIEICRSLFLFFRWSRQRLSYNLNRCLPQLFKILSHFFIIGILLLPQQFLFMFMLLLKFFLLSLGSILYFFFFFLYDSLFLSFFKLEQEVSPFVQMIHQVIIRIHLYLLVHLEVVINYQVKLAFELFLVHF